MQYSLIILVSYLIGCANLARTLARRKHVDLGSSGSGNPGTSNAAILLGWKAGVLVGLHDIGKAVLAVWAAKLLFPTLAYAGAAAGVACVLGHIFPIHMKFRGGKGFASFLGMTLALDWKMALVILAAVIVITLVTDYLVVGTVTTVVTVPIWLGISRSSWELLLLVGLASAVILLRHRENYVRIWKGTEIGLRSTAKGKHRIR